MSEFFETNHKRYGKKIKQKLKPCTTYWHQNSSVSVLCLPSCNNTVQTITIFPSPYDAPWLFLRNFRKKWWWMYINFSNLLEENRIVLLHTKISNHNIIYSSQKPKKSLPLPLKSSAWLFSLNAFKFGNNTYPRRIRRRSNLGHIFW